jgi:large subunit ribosomal protein L28
LQFVKSRLQRSVSILKNNFCRGYPPIRISNAQWSDPISKFSIVFFENLRIIPTFAVQNSDGMSRVCQLTGKRPITGNSVSHSNIKTKRRFLPNLQQKRFFLAEEDKWVSLKLSTEGIRTINKKGLYAVVKELRKAGEKI